jgi:hypothetical protein
MAARFGLLPSSIGLLLALAPACLAAPAEPASPGQTLRPAAAQFELAYYYRGVYYRHRYRGGYYHYRYGGRYCNYRVRRAGVWYCR